MRARNDENSIGQIISPRRLLVQAGKGDSGFELSLVEYVPPREHHEDLRETCRHAQISNASVKTKAYL